MEKVMPESHSYRNQNLHLWWPLCAAVPKYESVALLSGKLLDASANAIRVLLNHCGGLMCGMQGS